MEHKIKIKLTSRRTEIGEALLRSLFDSVLGEEAENILFTEGNGSNKAVAEDTIEMNTEGVLRLSGNRVEIAYDESELTGMEGASTVISFDTDEPSLVTMMRGGTVSTALIFEPHRRHICAYHTPFMPFEVCVLAHAVDNRLLGEGKSLEEIDARRHTLEEEAAAISREIALTEKTCRGYESELETRDELIMKRAELEERLARNEENYNVILLTKKYLQAARENMTVRYLGKTKAGFEKYAEAISGVCGEEFIMDTDFAVSKTDGGKAHPKEAYSRGTRDLYDLAARLALVDSLYEGEKPFIILDDPFCSFDDQKTKEALKLLKSFANERQIIYFTCSASREA